MTAPLPPMAWGRIPRVVFGAGRRQALARLAAEYGRRVLLVVGSRALEASGRLDSLLGDMAGASLEVSTVHVAGEPTPETVDAAVREYHGRGIQAVVAVGGGSVIDTGKAVSAMLPSGEPVQDYLEGVGQKKHDGRKLPFLAVPTTAGTGTEATKNASIKRVGSEGFKNSLRHENFVPDAALVDPELTLTCPPAAAAASAMDALAQLIESYVSPAASPFTDALAESGLRAVGDRLPVAAGVQDGDRPAAAAAMAYAALLSGITLANAGLGVVHSLSSVIGGKFEIPHGVICGTLLAAGTRVNVDMILRSEGAASPALRKHARAAECLTGGSWPDAREGAQRLVDILEGYTQELSLPRLGAYGVAQHDVPNLAAGTPNRNNPIPLAPADIAAILAGRL